MDRFDAKIDRLVDKQEKIMDSIVEINQTLGQQHISLQEHMYRTQLLETRLAATEDFVIPIKKHVLFVNATAKVIGVIVAGITFITGIVVAMDKTGIIDFSKWFGLP